MSETRVGHVWLVGGGPGDPGLITQAGLDALRQAGGGLYDRLSPVELLEAHLRQIEKHQLQINALVVVLAEEARQEQVARELGGALERSRAQLEGARRVMRLRMQDHKLKLNSTVSGIIPSLCLS